MTSLGGLMILKRYERNEGGSLKDEGDKHPQHTLLY